MGSGYFAHYPTVDRGTIVADLNVDQVPMLWPIQDIIAFGSEHSSLDVAVRRAAERMHLAVTPDPVPEEVVFIRSDQYSFVQQGIPAIMPEPGIRSSDPEIKPMDIFMNWLTTRQHQPNDDMQQPGLNFEAGAMFARYMFLLRFHDRERPAKTKLEQKRFFCPTFRTGG